MPKRDSSRKDVPTVRLKRNDYQPTKAEMKESFRIPTTPEKLANSVMRTVKIKRED